MNAFFRVLFLLDTMEEDEDELLGGKKSAIGGVDTIGRSKGRGSDDRSVGELDSMVLLRRLCLGTADSISMSTDLTMTGGWDKGDGRRNMLNERCLSNNRGPSSSALAPLICDDEDAESCGVGSVYVQAGSSGAKRN